jgi:hypothetical protein
VNTSAAQILAKKPVFLSFYQNRKGKMRKIEKRAEKESGREKRKVSEKTKAGSAKTR